MGPKTPRPRILTEEEEAIILAFRWRTCLTLNACHERLSHLMPKLSRSTLSRCLKRYGLGRIAKTLTAPPLSGESLMRGLYIFEITAVDVVFLVEGLGFPRQLFLAVEEVTKQVYAEVVIAPTPENAVAFLVRLVAQSPQKIIAVATDIRPVFTDPRVTLDEDMAEFSPHPFAVACRAAKIAHIRSPNAKPAIFRPRGVEIRYSADD
jgi:hypothetical protein